MIRPNSLIKLLSYLTGQNYEIDHLNVSPTTMRGITQLFKKIKIYEIRFFDDYLIIYMKSKPIVIKSYGWITHRGLYEMYFDAKNNQMIHEMIIHFK